MENSNEPNASPKTLKELINTWTFWKPVVAVAVGSTLGFLNYYYVGCTSGNCGIAGNLYLSILVGGLMGLFVIYSPCSRGRC